MPSPGTHSDPCCPALWTAVLLVAGTLFALNMSPALAYAAPATAGRLAAAAPADTAVTTFKNDVERDGDFSNETILNESNVNATQFGKRVQYSVDGQVYAEPLYLPNLTVNGAAHNVVARRHRHLKDEHIEADPAGRPQRCCRLRSQGLPVR